MQLIFQVRRPEPAKCPTEGLVHMLPWGKCRALVSPLLRWGYLRLCRSVLLSQPCPSERQGCCPGSTTLPLCPHLRLNKNSSHSGSESLFLCFFALSFLCLHFSFSASCDHVAETKKTLSPRVAHTQPSGATTASKTWFANQTCTGKLGFMFLLSD